MHDGGVNSTTATAFPAARAHALARAVEAVRAAQSDDPLAAVTVLVPSFGSGRDLTRLLARSGGAAGVRVRTPAQAVAELAAPVLAPRGPLPFPVLAAAVEAALDAEPGAFDPVAAEPVTAEALARACLRLGTVDADAVRPVTPLHAEVLRIAARVREHTRTAYHEPVEALETALDRLDALGTVIPVTPLEGTELERRLGAALRERGVRAVDADVLDSLPHAGTPDAPGAVVGTEVLHASDPDDEVRAVVRVVRERIAAGVPGHRIGVYFPSPDPYLRLLHRAFAEAGIAVSGPGTTTAGRGPAGRTLIRLLELDPAVMPRAELLSIVAEGALPVPGPGGSVVSGRRCELLTRGRVPVIGGADWERLAGYAGEAAAVRATESGATENGTDEPAEADARDLRDAETAAALSTLVRSLSSELTAVRRSRSWGEVGDRLRSLVERHLRPGPDRERVLGLLAPIADLAATGSRVDPARIARAVAVRLDAAADRVGEEGAGVALGPIDDAVGRDLDTVCVVGMAEGLLPVVHRPDPLLPEGAVEPPAPERLDHRHRVLQLALLAGSAQRVCSFPRGSMRGGGNRLPSRWLLPTLSALAGESVQATQWEPAAASSPRVTAVESFASAVVGARPATPAEFRLRRLASTGWVADESLPAGVRRAHALRTARRRGDLGPWTGDVSGVRELVRVLDGPLSPTRLEDWAQSPYLFFLTTVSGVRVLDEPAETTELDLREHGTLVHDVLRRYVDARIETGSGPDPELLREAFRIECDELLAVTPSLVESLWRHHRRQLEAELESWYAEDELDADLGWSPVATEERFGRGGIDVLYEVPGPAGPRTLHLDGSIDRLDERAGLLRVTDYKTGRAPGPKDPRPSAEDPTLGGTRFQLPLYAVAAEALHPGPVSSVRYWYCTERGGFDDSSELRIDADVLARVSESVGALAEAIDGGLFPLRGGRGSARDLTDLLGADELDRAWERLSRNPRIREDPAFVGMVDDPPGGATTSARSAPNDTDRDGGTR